MKLYPRTPRIEYILPPARDNSRKITPCAGGSISPPALHILLHLPSTNLEASPSSALSHSRRSWFTKEVGLQKLQRNKSEPVSDRNRIARLPPPLPYPRGAREHRTGHDQEPVENRKRKPGQASLYAIETARRKAHSSLYTQWLRSLVLNSSLEISTWLSDHLDPFLSKLTMKRRGELGPECSGSKRQR